MGQKSSPIGVQRDQIVTLHGEDYTQRKIFERLTLSKTAVHNAIVKHRIGGILCSRKRYGRTCKTGHRWSYRRVVALNNELQRKSTSHSASQINCREHQCWFSAIERGI